MDHSETSGVEAGFLRRHRPTLTWLLRMSVIITVLWIATALGRAPSRGNEAAAIGAIRAVVAAEDTFAAVSGHYGSWACLVAPECVPGLRVAGSFIDPNLMDVQKRSGYRLALLGSAADQVPEAQASDQLLPHYAVIAQPIGLPAARSFCGDDTRGIFETSPGPSVVRDGRCMDRSRPIR